MPDINIHNLKTSAYCPHCHQYTLITVVDANLLLHGSIPARCVYRGRVPGQMWWIGECHSCNGVVLVLNNGISIYPKSKPQPSDERIPDDIKEDFDEAKMCFSVNCYRASTAMSRRALETCCINKGANKDKNLKEMIEDLFNLKIITKNVKEWGDTIRFIGNDAVHINANKVEREDAEDILKITKQILDIIYIFPAIAKERLDKREESKKEKVMEEEVK